MAFSSLYIGATGLTAYSDGMQVISNNLANVSTTGYKQADAFYNSLISQQMATGSNRSGANTVGISQKGMGVALGGIKTSFRQGGAEGTSTATEMALDGNGFFGVRDAESGNLYYTRDGSFRFDNEGYLLNAKGMRVQGGTIDRLTGSVGAMGDILLPLAEYTNGAGDTFEAVQSEPNATSAISLSANLDFSSADETTSTSNPLFALFESWNGLAEDPVGASSYTTALGVYDAEGNRHTLEFNFDEVSSDTLSGAAAGYSYWEYTLTMDPAEDGRALFQGTSSAGMLAFGTLSFADGIMMDMSAFTFGAGAASPASLSNWSPAAFNADGQPTFDIAFQTSGAGATQSQTIGFDFGLTSTSGTWSQGGASNAGVAGAQVASLAGLQDMDRDSFVSTNYDRGSSTNLASQDGYARGFLQSLDVDVDGTLVGNFSNGQSEGLFKVGVYRFNSEYGLHRDGGNLFQATAESGAAIEGFAQEDGRGTVKGSSLEMSNVDMSEQFVRLIVTQRGFQSNTKVITTSDSILQTAISIKR